MSADEAPPAPAEKEPVTEKAASAKTETAPAKKAAAKGKKSDAPKAPRRPALEPEAARLLAVRRATSDRRAKFTRQASYRYWRIGRDGAWRRPRGQQSKQRRHYQYRSTIVSIGFRGPAAARGLTPSGFRPVIVRTLDDVDGVAPKIEAAIIARGVGTRRRLVLEEAARKRGVHILNPIVREQEE
jgi:large subunit ribosomal protein L32e